MRALSARSSRSRRQPLSLTRGSWISLFAMLMIFIGPLISQSMPMDSRAAMSMNMSMDMSMDMSSMDHGDHAAMPAAEHCPPKASHHAIWEKCGYCSLLFSCPALPGSVSYITLGTAPPANARPVASAPPTASAASAMTILPRACSRSGQRWEGGDLAGYGEPFAASRPTAVEPVNSR